MDQWCRIGGDARTARRPAGSRVAILPVMLAMTLAGALAAAAGGAEGDTAAVASKDHSRAVKAMEYLTGQYAGQLDSSDWIARAAAAISLSRMPTDGATEAIAKQLKAERHVVGQLAAWQAMLARAKLLTDQQFQAWEEATWPMVKQDAFHGDLRIGLLEMLSARPLTNDGRTYFRGLLARTSSLDSADIPTLIAMGRALGAWGDEELVELLIRGLGSPHTAVRSELVLQAAGVGEKWVLGPSAGRVYAEWWKQNKEKFTAKSIGPRAWRKLRPQFVPGPIDPATFDTLDRRWRGEMELGRLQLGSFAFGVAIDCSRSMRAEIDRLKRDMRVMFAAFSMIAREVGVGVTLFAPGVLVRHLPLTGDVGRLMAYVNAADIFGPAGEEEWYGALKTTIEGSRWPTPGEFSRRAIVILSDEPITEPQGRRAVPLAEKAGKEGFRIYGVMIRSLLDPPNNPLSVPFDRTMGGSVFDDDAPGKRAGRGAANDRWAGARGWGYYDQIAKAAGGRAIEVYVPQGGLGLGLPITGQTVKGGGKGGGKGGNKAGNKAGKQGGGKVSPMAIAPIYPGGGPTGRILAMVLTDAINPLHADRIEPLVKVLVAYCQKAAARIPERRTWGTPDRMEPNRAD